MACSNCRKCGPSSLKVDSHLFCDSLCYLEYQRRPDATVTPCIACKKCFRLPSNATEQFQYHKVFLCSKKCLCLFRQCFRSFCRGCGEFSPSSPNIGGPGGDDLCSPECREMVYGPCVACGFGQNEGLSLYSLALPDGRLKRCCMNPECMTGFDHCLNQMCSYCCQEPPVPERRMRMEFADKKVLLFCNAECLRSFVQSRTKENVQYATNELEMPPNSSLNMQSCQANDMQSKSFVPSQFPQMSNRDLIVSSIYPFGSSVASATVSSNQRQTPLQPFSAQNFHNPLQSYGNPVATAQRTMDRPVMTAGLLNGSRVPIALEQHGQQKGVDNSLFPSMPALESLNAAADGKCGQTDRDSDSDDDIQVITVDVNSNETHKRAVQARCHPSDNHISLSASTVKNTLTSSSSEKNETTSMATSKQLSSPLVQPQVPNQVEHERCKSTSKPTPSSLPVKENEMKTSLFVEEEKSLPARGPVAPLVDLVEEEEMVSQHEANGETNKLDDTHNKKSESLSLTNVPVVSESKTHATVDRNTPNDTTDTLPPKYTCNLKPMTCDVSTEAAATSVNVQSEQCASPAKSAQTSAVGDSVEKEAEVVAATQGAIDERSSDAGDLICEACGCTVTFETHPTYCAKHNSENSRLVIYCSRQCRSTYEQQWVEKKRCNNCTQLKPVGQEVRVAGKTSITVCSSLCYELYKQRYLSNCGVTLANCAFCGKCFLDKGKGQSSAAATVNNDDAPCTSSRDRQQFCAEKCKSQFKKRLRDQNRCGACMKRSSTPHQNSKKSYSYGGGEGVDIFWKGEPKHFCDRKCLLIFYQHANSINMFPVENPTNRKRTAENNYSSTEAQEIASKSKKVYRDRGQILAPFKTVVRPRRLATRNVGLMCQVPTCEKSVQKEPSVSHKSTATEVQNDLGRETDKIFVPVPMIVFVPIPSNYLCTNRSIPDNGKGNGNSPAEISGSQNQCSRITNSGSSGATADQRPRSPRCSEPKKKANGNRQLCLADQINSIAQAVVEKTRKELKLTEERMVSELQDEKLAAAIACAFQTVDGTKSVDATGAKTRELQRFQTKQIQSESHLTLAKIKAKAALEANSRTKSPKKKSLKDVLSAKKLKKLKTIQDTPSKSDARKCAEKFKIKKEKSKAEDKKIRSSSKENSTASSFTDEFVNPITAENLTFNFFEDFGDLAQSAVLPPKLRVKLECLRQLFSCGSDIEKAMRSFGIGDGKEKEENVEEIRRGGNGCLNSGASGSSGVSLTADSHDDSSHCNSNSSDDESSSLASIRSMQKEKRRDTSEEAVIPHTTHKSRSQVETSRMNETSGQHKKKRRDCASKDRVERTNDLLCSGGQHQQSCSSLFSDKFIGRVGDCVAYVVGLLYSLHYGHQKDWHVYSKHQPLHHWPHSTLDKVLKKLLLLHSESENGNGRLPLQLPLEIVRLKVMAIVFIQVHFSRHSLSNSNCPLFFSELMPLLTQTLNSAFKQVPSLEWKKAEEKSANLEGRGHLDRLMWMSGLLGYADSHCLQFTVHYHIVREFGIYDLGEHKLLTRSHFLMQESDVDQTRQLKFRNSGTIKYDDEDTRLIKAAGNSKMCGLVACEKYMDKMPEVKRPCISMFYREPHRTVSSYSKDLISDDKICAQTLEYYLRLTEILQSSAKFFDRL